MILYIDGHDYHYEMENLCAIFLPYEKIKVVEALPEEIAPEEIVAVTRYREAEGVGKLYASLRIGGKTLENSSTLPLSDAAQEPFDKICAVKLALLLYGLFVKLCNYEPKWGVLIGVRPIKLLRKLTADMGEEAALRYFLTELKVSPEKTELSRLTMQNEQKILSLSRPESYSLYVSIPFCPTRCAYCSFVASSMEKTKKLIPGYVDLLCEELVYTAKVAKELGLRLETIYFGGGTPTTLTAEQLSRLLDTIHSHFDLSTCRELTVEAGRPDTITAEKLLAMKERGVTRISINPQTMNDDVLRRIGRHHTAAQTEEAFSLARRCGMDNINMDVIAGLPGDTGDSFRSTMDQLTSLDPESITVHTLALKRSSDINQNGKKEFHNDAALAGEMLDYSQSTLTKHGYEPYYLYRQSRMVGNLENTGWAKPGYANLYNVYIMDETHTILACGAGAVSKIRDPYSERLERVFNFKYPYEYRDRFHEMLERKEKVKEIYTKFGIVF
ncbi:MAG: coproporphyrinogen dehydrogenase HemZ [Oscillospiraceae bacterium]|nr:coproporphyrinogen dehydrogenase HemZ [Oscillospiraceae bacterium]